MTCVFLLPKPRDQTSVFRHSEWRILQNGKTLSGSYSALRSLAALASAFGASEASLEDAPSVTSTSL